jgi:xanthine permease XanP
VEQEDNDYEPESHLHTVLQNRQDNQAVDDSSPKTLSRELG